MSAHTPGPWKADKHQQVRAENGQMLVADIRGWGHLTGKGALGLPAEIAEAIQDANGRLVAASPDLFAWALKSAHRTECSFGFRSNVCDCGRDAAIAKAMVSP